MSEAIHTVEHAAQRLKLHPKTVLRAIREGRLRAAKVGKSYRILQSDLDAFAGVSPKAGSPAGEARVTAVVDIPGADADLARRLMTMVPAAWNARQPGAARARVDVVYDPELRLLKVIVVAPPADAGALLKLIQVWLEG